MGVKFTPKFYQSAFDVKALLSVSGSELKRRKSRKYRRGIEKDRGVPRIQTMMFSFGGALNR